MKAGICSYIGSLCCVLAIVACSRDNDEMVTVDAPKGVATVT